MCLKVENFVSYIYSWIVLILLNILLYEYMLIFALTEFFFLIISSQARKLKDSLSRVSDGLHEWASKTLLVAEAYKKLSNLITDTPTQLTETKVFQGMF